jgi:hypothetical protein
MKRYYSKLILLAAIVVAASWNISQNRKRAKLSEVASANIEALAGGESNPPYLWPFQGTTKDERSVTENCSYTISFNFFVFEYSETMSGKKTMCYSGGTTNCTQWFCS